MLNMQNLHIFTLILYDSYRIIFQIYGAYGSLNQESDRYIITPYP